jgi:hypothetical protein
MFQVLFPRATVTDESFRVAAPVVKEAESCVAVPAPERLLKVTVSVVAGMQVQLAPPEVVDQFAVEEKLPVPPIQKHAPPVQAAAAFAVNREKNQPTAPRTSLRRTLPTSGKKFRATDRSVAAETEGPDRLLFKGT